MESAGDVQLLQNGWVQAASEGRLEDLIELSTHFTGDVNALSLVFYKACMCAQLNVVKWLVEHTVLRDDVEALRHVLRLASWYGELNVVTWLVENTELRDNVEALNNGLTSAIRNNRFNVVTWLVEHTVLRHNVEALNDGLTSAITRGQLNVVTWLVEHTVLRDNVKALNDGLMNAIRNDQLNVITWLVEHTVLRHNVGALRNKLTSAIKSGQLNVVTRLVEHTVLCDDVSFLNVAFQLACRHEQWNIAMFIIKSGADDVNITLVDRYSRNWPTLMHRIIDFNGINLHVDDGLRFVWRGSMRDVCKWAYVDNQYVDINIQSQKGNTALHGACIIQRTDIAGALLLAGADETITNDMGCTPIQLLDSQRPHSEMLSLLDVSSKWKVLVRSHRLRQRTAVQVMMALVESKVESTRISMGTQATLLQKMLRQITGQKMMFLERQQAKRMKLL
jgi:hypothetical protein